MRRMRFPPPDMPSSDQEASLQLPRAVSWQRIPSEGLSSNFSWLPRVAPSALLGALRCCFDHGRRIPLSSSSNASERAIPPSSSFWCVGAEDSFQPIQAGSFGANALSALFLAVGKWREEGRRRAPPADTKRSDQNLGGAGGGNGGGGIVAAAVALSLEGEPLVGLPFGGAFWFGGAGVASGCASESSVYVPGNKNLITYVGDVSAKSEEPDDFTICLPCHPATDVSTPTLHRKGGGKKKNPTLLSLAPPSRSGAGNTQSQVCRISRDD